MCLGCDPSYESREHDEVKAAATTAAISIHRDTWPLNSSLQELSSSHKFVSRHISGFTIVQPFLFFFHPLFRATFLECNPSPLPESTSTRAEAGMVVGRSKRRRCWNAAAPKIPKKGYEGMRLNSRNNTQKGERLIGPHCHGYERSS